MDTPMNHAIRIHETGGPEKMVWEEVPLPSPKPGEALVRHKAVGLNYIDVYFRTGLYKAPSMPARTRPASRRSRNTRRGCCR